LGRLTEDRDGVRQPGSAPLHVDHTGLRRGLKDLEQLRDPGGIALFRLTLQGRMMSKHQCGETSHMWGSH
jgi:hypothetical protein